MRKVLAIMSCISALVIALGVIYLSRNYFVIDPPAMSYLQFKNLVKTQSGSIEEVVWLDDVPKLVVTLKNQKVNTVYLSPEQQREILPEMRKCDFRLLLSWEEGRHLPSSIEPSLDWLSEQWHRSFPGGGSNNNRAN